MPFQILRNDITNMQVDAIVNTANPRPKIGYGVDAGIHKKAGPGLLAARLLLGNIPVGSAAITKGYRLSAKYVIHAVGPVWQGGGHGEEALLRSCYTKSLQLAAENGCKSIAFPLISAGNHGFPKPLALQIALGAISDFLLEQELQVYLVIFSKDALNLTQTLFRDVKSYIDENYILQKNLEQYGVDDKCSLRQAQQQEVLEHQMQLRRKEVMESPAPCAPPPGSAPKKSGSFRLPRPSLPRSKPPAEASPAPFLCPTMPAADYSCGYANPVSLEEMLRQEDAGFSETLLKLIDRSGKKDSYIYTRANVSRQHFSKIRNNPGYKPTKTTALAFAIALELDLEQTQDLIGRAGYALTRSSKADLIIMYFIRKGNYNLFDINAALFEFDQSLLGA